MTSGSPSRFRSRLMFIVESLDLLHFRGCCCLFFFFTELNKVCILHFIMLSVYLYFLRYFGAIWWVLTSISSVLL
uniref:Ovule protein n=1 Tax=Parascaris univalens TaxID=6257 RepID=A0A915C302_PARUN